MQYVEGESWPRCGLLKTREPRLTLPSSNKRWPGWRRAQARIAHRDIAANILLDREPPGTAGRLCLVKSVVAGTK